MTDRNWTEDASHENGNYECRCCECDQMFIGHKRRVICKACSNLLTPAVRQAASQGSAKCDCGFSGDICSTNPCMRKKLATSGLMPDAKYPNVGKTQAASQGSAGGEKQASDAPVWYAHAEAHAWADGYNAALSPPVKADTTDPLYDSRNPNHGRIGGLVDPAQASRRPTEITKEMALAGRKALALVADRMEEAKLLATSSIDFWQRVGHEPANEIYAAMVEASVVPSADGGGGK